MPYATGVHTASVPLPAGCETGSLNDWTELTGSCSPGDTGTAVVFRWDRARGIQYLTFSNSDTTASPRRVNNSGQVLVELSTFTGGPSPNAAIWEWSGALRLLRPVSTYASYCLPGGINDLGAVVGGCDVSLNFFATTWTPFGTPDVVNVAGGPALGGGAFATAISDAGYVAGWGGPDDNAWLFTPSRQLLILPMLQNVGAYAMQAMAVNSSGAAAGNAETGNGNCPNEAVVWLQPDSVTDLGVCGQALGITDDNVVVGTGTPNGAEPLDSTFAFVWTAAGGLRRLPNLFGNSTRQNSSASAINRKYQIVGVLRSGPRNALSNPTYTMLWTVPAPTTANNAVEH